MKPSDALLVCTDLDRTVIPNGAQEESELARPTFRHVTECAQIKLCYVSGRDIERILSAIEAYELPSPDFIVADVGTSVYQKNSAGWKQVNQWQEQLSSDWCAYRSQSLAVKIAGLQHLQLQQANQQGPFKLSYQVSPSRLMEADLLPLENSLKNIVPSNHEQALKYKVITSIDETCDEGLVDVLPQSAGKLGAVRFLVDYLGLEKSRVYFSGDSGNDRDVLLSEFNACLVNNATQAFKDEILESAKKLNASQTIYLANGKKIAHLNGNYSAGVVEGLVHFFPELEKELPEGAL